MFRPAAQRGREIVHGRGIGENALDAFVRFRYYAAMLANPIVVGILVLTFAVAVAIVAAGLALSIRGPRLPR